MDIFLLSKAGAFSDFGLNMTGCWQERSPSWNPYLPWPEYSRQSRSMQLPGKVEKDKTNNTDQSNKQKQASKPMTRSRTLQNPTSSSVASRTRKRIPYKLKVLNMECLHQWVFLVKYEGLNKTSWLNDIKNSINHHIKQLNWNTSDFSSYRGEDLADGSFDLEVCGAAVHVPADHVGHRLQTDRRRNSRNLWSACFECSRL